MLNNLKDNPMYNEQTIKKSLNIYTSQKFR
jgi:hypothetical protein